MRTFSWSEIYTFETCRRKWYFTYFLGLKPKDEIPVHARSVGLIIHKLLEMYYFPGNDYDNPLQPLLDALDTAESEDFEKLIKKKIRLVSTIFDNYRDWLAEEKVDDEWDFQESEQYFRVEPPTSFYNVLQEKPEYKLTGYIDMLAEHRNTGIRTIFEHKTTGRTYSQWMIQSLPLAEWQAKLYCILSGLNHVTFNVMRRNLGTARATPPLFWRYNVFYNETQLRSAAKYFSDAIKRIQEYEKIATSVRHWPSIGLNCSSCAFKNVCPTMDDIYTDFQAVLDLDFEPRYRKEHG